MKQAFKNVWAARKTVLPCMLLGLLAGVYVQAKQSPMAMQVARLKSVVRLIDQDGRTFCSGVIVGRSIAVTAAHCVGNEKIRIMLQSGEIIDASVVKVDPRGDTAVLIGNFESAPSKAKIITAPEDVNSALTSKKRRLVACGYPKGARLYCSAFKPNGKQVWFYKGKGVAIPGMSGGAVMDADSGEVFAVVSQVSEDGEICAAPLFEVLAGIWETSNVSPSSQQ